MDPLSSNPKPKRTFPFLTGAEWMILGMFILQLTIWGAAVAVIWHFVSKWW